MYRFDLEKAIAAWRHSLRQNQAFLEEDLDELESHLRDHVEALVASGLPLEEAYRRALERLGSYGELESEYRKVRFGRSKRKRHLWKSVILETYMLKNYLKVAWRNLHRQKGYALINLAGLTIGIASFLLILLAVRHELSYDRFHPHTDHLYRVVQDVSWGDGMTWDVTGPVMGPTLAKDFPEIEAMTRFHKVSALVSYEGAGDPVRYQEEAFGFVDPAFFSLFAFPFIQGDPATALSEPQAVVLTESMATKYFGDDDPLGKLLRLDNRMDLKVTGVIADLPTNSHIDFDFAASFQTLHSWYDTNEFSSWWWPSVSTYVRLVDEADAAILNSGGLAAFVKRHREPHYAEAIIPRLQPVTDIHLYGNPGGHAIRFVYIFSVIAALVLLIACVNYMNLATARAASRAREVGVRKAIGARRGQLAGQFFGESVLVTVLSLGAAVVLAGLMLPFFNELSGRSLALDLDAGWLWLSLLAIGAVVSVLAGSYPALVLSSFAPVHVLKGTASRMAGGRRLRQGLVVFQFTITVALLAGTFIVYNQVRYMRTKALGFDTEQVVVLRLRDDQDRYASFKEALKQQPGVVSVAATSWNPGVSGGGVYATTLDGRDIDNDPYVLFADHDFFRTLGIELAEGRFFSEDFASDVQDAFILNEAAVRQYEIEDPIGKEVRLFAAEGGNVVYEKRGQVVGVVQDFHLESLHVPIYPTVITLGERPNYLSKILVRLAPGHAGSSLEHLEALWHAHFPQRLFEARFIDEQTDALYRQEVQFGRTVGVLAVLAILIACLGLFGLAAFAAEQRTKEIGIRKVLGATVANIVLLLSKDFLRLVALAFILAVPLAYVGMERWLEDFAYRIKIGMWVFLVAGVLAFTIALLTVSYQAVRAALTDPVRSLRYE